METYGYKCLIIVYKLFHIFLGLDFGFFNLKSFKIKVISKVFAFMQSLMTCAFLCTDVSSKNIIVTYWYTSSLIQYVVCILIVAFIKEETSFSKLIHDLKTERTTFHLEVKLLLSVLICVLYRTSLFLVHCYYYSNDACLKSWHNILYVLILFALDVILITYAFMFLAINYQIKNFILVLRLERFDFVSKQYLYKSIIDTVERHKASFDPVFLTSLLFNIPHVMAAIYTSVQEIKVNKTPTLGVGITAAIGIMIMTIIPAIFAGMIPTQIEKIKIELHETALQKRDQIHLIQDIEWFIRYVEARPCRFRVYKLIPLNADLLGLVLSFCVTYLIVIAQFTHLY